MPTSKELANCIRALSMDAVQKANSGHPGAPLGMADMATVLWRDFLKHNPANPGWADRDRFVLSNGHGSMLIYSLLHLTGYDVTLDDIKNFRQLHSKTPGHPEFGYTPGVEVTTGPLGQGLANATGFAIAEKCLAAEFNRPGHDIIDHFTYAFTGDGCLMEGVSHEACSLAGTLGLGKLIVLYDDNGISIDGEVQDWFTDDTPGRFESYGWQVIAGVDGHDPAAINAAIEKARADLKRPTLICCKTVIGYGSPNKQNTASCHGSPLGDDEIALTRAELGWEYGPFEIPDELAAAWNGQAAGAKAEADWNQRLESYRAAHPELATELERRLSGDLPTNFESKMKELVHHLAEEEPTVATRKASQMVLEELTGWLPEMMGGSADLAGSNLTITSHSEPVTREQGGNYIYYGVREFAMSAIMNGLALHGGFIPYGGTFLVFTEYARNAVRMAALMKQRVVFVYTHDSIALGEDGPTHQAVEQIPSMRLTPNLVTWRPADTVETAVAWESAVTRNDGPTALALSRQNLDHQPRTVEQIANIKLGGYILCDCDGEPELILMATGSEVGITRAAWQQLTDDGRRVRLVAMPSVDVFLAQDATYRNAVLPDNVRARLAVEAAQPDLWYQLVGLDGDVIGISTFGESAPAGVLLKEFGFTAENVFRHARALLS